MMKSNVKRCPCCGYLLTDEDAPAADIIAEAHAAVSVPIYEKALLTVEEAAAYTSISETKLRELAHDKRNDFVLRNGRVILFKRKKLLQFIDATYYI